MSNTPIRKVDISETEAFRGLTSHADPTEQSDKDTPKVTHITKVGRKLFVVNGVDELQTYDGTKINMNPTEAGEK